MNGPVENSGSASNPKTEAQKRVEKWVEYNTPKTDEVFRQISETDLRAIRDHLGKALNPVCEFSKDPHRFALNAIDEMKAQVEAALALLPKPHNLGQ